MAGWAPPLEQGSISEGSNLNIPMEILELPSAPVSYPAQKVRVQTLPSSFRPPPSMLKADTCASG